MKKPQRRSHVIGVIASLSVSALLLGGCAGGGGQADPTDGEGGEGQKLVVWMDPVFAPALEEAVAGFEEQYDVQIDVQPTEFLSILGSYQQAAPAGSGPDLADVNVDHFEALTEADLALALDLGDKADDIDPRALAGYTVDGEVMGLPLVLESSNLWRNPDLVPEAPTTWAELREVALDLQAKGVEYPFVMDNNAYVFNGMLTGFGGYVFKQNDDGSYDINDVGVDTPGGVEALSYVAQAVQEGWLKPGVDVETVTAAWGKGQVGLHFSGPWMLDAYEESGVPFAVDMIPAGPSGPAIPFLSARGLVVNPISEESALASTLLTKYLASDEPMSTFAKSTGKQSAWLPVAESAADDTTRAFAAAAVNAQPIPKNRQIASYWSAMEDALLLILQGQATPEDAAATAAQRVRDAVAGKE